MKIEYENEAILIHVGGKVFKITEFSELYLVQEQFKNYRNKCRDEKSFNELVGLIDQFESIRRQFTHDKEVKCLRNLLSIPEFVPNTQNSSSARKLSASKNSTMKESVSSKNKWKKHTPRGNQ